MDTKICLWTANTNIDQNWVWNTSNLFMKSYYPTFYSSKSIWTNNGICANLCFCAMFPYLLCLTRAWSLLGMELTRAAVEAAEMSSQASETKPFSDTLFWGVDFEVCCFRRWKPCSIGFKFGEWLGHDNVFHFFLERKAFVASLVCLGSLSACMTKFLSINFRAFVAIFLSKIALRGRSKTIWNSVKKREARGRTEPSRWPQGFFNVPATIGSYWHGLTFDKPVRLSLVYVPVYAANRGGHPPPY